VGKYPYLGKFNFKKTINQCISTENKLSTLEKKLSKRFVNGLDKAKTEEAVKAAFVREFDLKFNSENYVDLFVPPVLFEFKKDLNLKVKASTVLAQALYYVRRIRDESTLPMPTWISLIDKNEGALVRTEGCLEILEKSFDWERAPSSPDPELIKHIDITLGTIRVLDFNHELEEYHAMLTSALADATELRRPITGDNFEKVYTAWEKALGIENKSLTGLFVSDCCNDVWFDPNTGELKAKKDKGEAQVPVKAYQDFWSIYERPPTVDAQREIKSRRDRLGAIHTRRFEGEFYTPPLFCEKTVEYLNKALGEDWQDEYVVWDPAMGTGNLLWPLRVPGERVFGSTLHKADCESVDWYEDATVFQFDFLNDPVEKLPATLRDALERDKVLVLMNPPYADARGMAGSVSKSGIKNTIISEELNKIDLGKAANELFVQFFWRVNQLCTHASIAMFAKLKYINAPAFEKFREKVLDQYAFKGGMIFPAKVFNGTSGSWPVSFASWAPGEKMHTCQFDVLDTNGDKSGKKTISPKHEYLNGWFKRPKNIVDAVPLTNALTVAPPNYNIRLDKLSVNSIGYCCLNNNTPQTANQLFFLSGASYAGSNGSSITPELFEKVMVQVSVRKAIKPTWLNDRDQFQIPSVRVPGSMQETIDPSQLGKPEWNDFVTDCVVFNLFSGHNQTSEFTADYKDKKWAIKNQFFPFSPDLVKKYGPQTIAFQRNLPGPSFVHNWLNTPPTGHTKRVLTTAAAEVMKKAEIYYQLFFQNYANVNRSKWKIEAANPGFYQIRNSMKEAGIGLSEYDDLREAVKELQASIVPRVYEYGFLEPEMLYEEQ
jgi:hypothetical protein